MSNVLLKNYITIILLVSIFASSSGQCQGCHSHYKSEHYCKKQQLSTERKAVCLTSAPFKASLPLLSIVFAVLANTHSHTLL